MNIGWYSTVTLKVLKIHVFIGLWDFFSFLSLNQLLFFFLLLSCWGVYYTSTKHTKYFILVHNLPNQLSNSIF